MAEAGVKNAKQYILLSPLPSQGHELTTVELGWCRKLHRSLSILEKHYKQKQNSNFKS